MSLNITKLEKVRELPGRVVQARCPVCAEAGHDRAGEHLRIYPDGRFGCCVYPKDREHRKRIFALVGEHKPGTFTLRVAPPTATTPGRSVKAALTDSVPKNGTLQTKPLNSLIAVLDTVQFGTLGTGQVKSRAYAREELIKTPGQLKDLERGVPSVPNFSIPDLGTLGTPKVESRACAREEWDTMSGQLKDSETGVPSVPRMETALIIAGTMAGDKAERGDAASNPVLDFQTPRMGRIESRAYTRVDLSQAEKGPGKPEDVENTVCAVRTAPATERLPFLTVDGDLVIPFESPARYHWWDGGQSVAATMAEVLTHS